MAYRSILDRFDMERGDALTLTLETATELAALPCEIAAPVIYALLTWFAGGDVPTLPDPRDNALLRRLVVHQKQNAARRADILATKRENRRGKGKRETHATESGEDDGDGENARQRPSTGATDKIREDKSSVSKDLSCHAAGASSRAACASPPAGFSACALPADLPAQSERTVLLFSGYLSAGDAPAHAMDMTTFKDAEPMVSRTIAEADFRSDPVSVILPCADFDEESDKATFRNALIQRYKANPRQFMLIAWKYLAEAHNARIALVKAFRDKCDKCICPEDRFCNEECPHAYIRRSLADYAKDYGEEVFAKNLLGRLKVLKTSKPKK
jgi:hypothetical protein